MESEERAIAKVEEVGKFESFESIEVLGKAEELSNRKLLMGCFEILKHIAYKIDNENFCKIIEDQEKRREETEIELKKEKERHEEEMSYLRWKRSEYNRVANEFKALQEKRKKSYFDNKSKDIKIEG